jgi:hypothetical protein
LNKLQGKIHVYLDDIHNAIIIPIIPIVPIVPIIIAIMGHAFKMIMMINFILLVTGAIMGHVSKFKLKMTHFQDVMVTIKDLAWKMVHKMKLSHHAMVLIHHVFLMRQEMKATLYVMAAIWASVLEMVSPQSVVM